MRGIIGARLLRWKKDWKTIILWLLLPVVATTVLMLVGKEFTSDFKIPVAIVAEDDGVLIERLIEQIENGELLDVVLLPYDEALQHLARHELDSVFVFHRGFEDKLQEERYRNLVTSYRSNRSFAYPVTVEIIHSHIVEEATRIKATSRVELLYKEYGNIVDYNADDVIVSSKDRQSKTGLLSIPFSFYKKGEPVEKEDAFIIRALGVWAFIALLVTFFLFDWIIIENNAGIKMRWLYTRHSFSGYVMVSFMMYSLLLFLIDLIAIIILEKLFQELLSLQFILSVFLFRVTINLLASCVALIVKRKLLFYVSGLMISLFLAILGGALIPIDGLIREFHLVSKLSPITSLLSEGYPLEWLGCLVVIFFVLLRKAGGLFVRSK